jgi:hypothetical protein
VTDLRVAVVPGDGIGVEVIAEATKALTAVAQAAGKTIRLTPFDWGAERYLASGVSLPLCASSRGGPIQVPTRRRPPAPLAVQRHGVVAAEHLVRVSTHQTLEALDHVRNASVQPEGRPADEDAYTCHLMHLSVPGEPSIRGRPD